MTYEEAIKIVKNNIHNDYTWVIVEALEKQIKKKPVEYNLGGVAPFMFGTGKCPSCDEGCNSDMVYCDRCGQKLRWFDN